MCKNSCNSTDEEDDADITLERFEFRLGTVVARNFSSVTDARNTYTLLRKAGLQTELGVFREKNLLSENYGRIQMYQVRCLVSAGQTEAASFEEKQQMMRVLQHMGFSVTHSVRDYRQSIPTP